MKAKLEFDLPEEHEEFMNAVQGVDWKIVVHDFDEKLRRIIKDSTYDRYYSSIHSVHDILSETRNILHTIIDGHGLEL